MIFRVPKLFAIMAYRGVLAAALLVPGCLLLASAMHIPAAVANILQIAAFGVAIGMIPSCFAKASYVVDTNGIAIQREGQGKALNYVVVWEQGKPTITMTRWRNRPAIQFAGRTGRKQIVLAFEESEFADVVATVSQFGGAAGAVRTSEGGRIARFR